MNPSRNAATVSDRPPSALVDDLTECCRSFLGDAPPSLSGSHGVDTSRFLRLAVWHGIGPVVARVLRDGEDRPGADDEGWCSFLRSTSSYNRLLLGELGEIVEACRARRLPVVAFKGPALAGRGYGDVTLRQYYDLDLVTAPDALDAVESVLEGRGYRPARSLGPIRRSLFLYFERQLPFVRGDRTLKVDVHTALAPRRFLPADPTDAFLDRAVELPIEGSSLPVLAPTDALIALCLHGAKHRWEGLRLLLDVATFAESACELDWDRLRARSEEKMDPRLVRVGLALARELMAADLPDPVTRWIYEDGAVPALVDRVADRLPHVHRRSAGRLDRLFFHLWMRGRWDWRIPYLAGVLAHNSWTRSLWGGDPQ